MTEGEFEELNKLGNKIVQKNNKKNNKNKKLKLKIKKISIKSNKKISVKILLKKIFRKTKIQFRNIINYLKRINPISSLKLKALNLEKRNNKAYKIVESKKQRRNKVIIVRKRVPINNKIESKIVKNSACFYYINLDSDDKKDGILQINRHISLKKSIWDFPFKKSYLMNLRIFKNKK